MQVNLTKQEAWKILDAIKSYSKDYTVTEAVSRTFRNITKKLKDVVNE